MTQDYPEVRKFISLVQKAFDLFNNIDVKIKSTNDTTSFIYTDKTTGETSETVSAMVTSEKGNTTTVSNNIIGETNYLPCYIKANKQLAIAIHYGMVTFGFPTSSTQNYQMEEIIKTVTDIMWTTNMCSKYIDIPPTLKLEFLVLAVLRHACMTKELNVKIDPHLMKITKHNKEIDVWKMFSDSHIDLVVGNHPQTNYHPQTN